MLSYYSNAREYNSTSVHLVAAVKNNTKIISMFACKNKGCT